MFREKSKYHGFTLISIAVICSMLFSGCSASHSVRSASSVENGSSSSTNGPAASTSSGVTRSKGADDYAASKKMSSGAGSVSGSESKNMASSPAKEVNPGEPDISTMPVQQDPPHHPQAGQLTAGEWDDMLHWDWWEDLMNNQQMKPYQDRWGFYLYRRVNVLVMEGKQPAADAEVQLSSQAGTWQTRTNQQGKASLFIKPFNPYSNIRTFDITVHSGSQDKTLKDIKYHSNQTVKVQFQSSDSDRTLSNNVDIMFLVDTTGSMQDELKYLEAELKNVIERIQRTNHQQLHIRISSNFYRDHGDDYLVRSYPFTTHVDSVVHTISLQSAEGGGDYPEAVEVGLNDAINNHTWSSDARTRLLFMVLDAPPHHTDAILSKMQQLGKQAAAKGIHIIPVASSGLDKNTEFLLRFEDIVSGGTYVFLTNDSGIGNNHIQPTIGKYKVKKLNDLLVQVANHYISQSS